MDKKEKTYYYRYILTNRMVNDIMLNRHTYCNIFLIYTVCIARITIESNSFSVLCIRYA